MIVIDLRPYEKEKTGKTLQDIASEHIAQVKGFTQVIVELPDEIWITKNQKADGFPLEWTVDKHIIPVYVK